jgi:hypothetical protein
MKCACGGQLVVEKGTRKMLGHKVKCEYFKCSKCSQKSFSTEQLLDVARIMDRTSV